jgi:hypothetical protein
MATNRSRDDKNPPIDAGIGKPWQAPFLRAAQSDFQLLPWMPLLTKSGRMTKLRQPTAERKLFMDSTKIFNQ